MELVNLLTKIERTTLHRGSDGTNVALCDGLGLHMIDNELYAKYKDSNSSPIEFCLFHCK